MLCEEKISFTKMSYDNYLLVLYNNGVVGVVMTLKL